MVTIDRLEVSPQENDAPQWLKAQAWAGYDLHKLWLKTDVEREGDSTESADLELLYGQALAPFWDLQVGWKCDFESGPSRDWLAVGFQGLAPYLFELDNTLYLASGRASLKVEAEYELLLTQRLVLSPYLGVHWERAYGDTADFARAEGEDRGDLVFVMGIRASF